MAGPAPGFPGSVGKGGPQIQAPWAGMLGRMGSSGFGGGYGMQQFLRRRMEPQVPAQMGQPPLGQLPTPDQSGLPRGVNLAPPPDWHVGGPPDTPPDVGAPGMPYFNPGGMPRPGLPGDPRGGSNTTIGRNLGIIGLPIGRWTSGKNKLMYPSADRLGQVASTQQALDSGTYGPAMGSNMGQGYGEGPDSLLRKLLQARLGAGY